MSEEIKCKICNKVFSLERGLSYHITHSHKLSLEEYYLKYECLNPETAGKCIICGKPTPFISRTDGYQKTCSLSCGGKAGSALGHETMLKRYGKKSLNNPEKNKLFYEQHPEIKKQVYEHLSTVRKEQGINALVGEKNHKNRLAYKDNFAKECDCTMVYDLVYKYGQGWYKNRINILDESDYVVSDKYFNINMKFIKNSSIYKIINYCKENKFNQTSHGEKSVVEFVKSIYAGKVEENVRNIIQGFELDIYIPEKRLAIEYNGTYWHSIQAGCDKKYHFNKSLACEKVGIRLIHIYEFQWQDETKKLILQSIIKNALGINDNKIYARCCEIRELSSKDIIEFSNNNSLHAYRPASITIGLFYKQELVEVMTFGHAFFARDLSIDYECIRSITRLNTTVIGGMNKLFKYFINKYKPNKVLYYVDYNTHVGNSMSNLNFMFESYSQGGIINISNDLEITKRFGDIFNRKPAKNAEIKKLTSEGRILTIYDAGVKRYIWNKI